MSLNELYAAMLENTEQLLATPLASLSASTFGYVQLQDTIIGPLGQRLMASVQAFFEEMDPIVENALFLENILIGFLLPIVLTATLLLRHYSRRTRMSIDTIRGLLQMVPYEYVGARSAITKYLKHAKVRAIEAKGEDEDDVKVENQGDGKTEASNTLKRLQRRTANWWSEFVSGTKLDGIIGRLWSVTGTHDKKPSDMGTRTVPEVSRTRRMSNIHEKLVVKVEQARNTGVHVISFLSRKERPLREVPNLLALDDERKKAHTEKALVVSQGQGQGHEVTDSDKETKSSPERRVETATDTSPLPVRRPPTLGDGDTSDDDEDPIDDVPITGANSPRAPPTITVSEHSD